MGEGARGLVQREGVQLGPECSVWPGCGGGRRACSRCRCPGVQYTEDGAIVGLSMWRDVIAVSVLGNGCRYTCMCVYSRM